MPESEFILLRRFASNDDAEAFAEIIKQHASLVYGVCLRILEDKDKAADAVQETFLQLVRDAAEITGSLPNWLHRVATHKAINIIRTDSKRRQREEKYAADSEKIQSKRKLQIWQEISGCIDEELDQLDDLTREVLILHFFEGATMTCIAEKFGISQPTVSRRIESGVAALRYKLKSRGVLIPAAMLTAMLTENVVKAAPASIMKELGKIALAGGQAAATAIGTGILASLAAKAKIIATAAVIVLAVGSAAIYYNSNQQTIAADSITARELVEQYVQAVNSWDKSVAMRVETVIAQTRSETGETYDLDWTYDFQHRRDGNKCEVFGSIEYEDNRNGNISSWVTQFRTIVGDDFYFAYRRRDNEQGPENATMHSDVKNALNLLQLLESYGNFLEGWGNLDADTTCKIAELMKECKGDDLKLIGQETLNDTLCFIVEAKTLYGTYTVWIAPEKGYNALKHTLSKSGSDIIRDDISIDEQGMTLWEIIVDSIEVKKIDGIFIPVSGQYFSRTRNSEGGGFTTHQQVKRSEIVLNPDFEALDAFKIDMPEGTEVTHRDIPEMQFTWTNGKFVPDMDEYLPKDLMGKPLLSFDEILKGYEPASAAGKMVLVCFWDMNQRPSRNCIIQLSNRARELKAQDVEIIAIHASATEQDTLDEWVKENNISFPVGMIESDEQKTQIKWGVKSLPWVILTDKNHIVTAEGFSIAELDEKIAASEER